ncbi:YncE family protein [Reichenbachiella ulvae]|uniref:40-residue YVTN family beta-propeller repeat-containing protein n=1 Tax=Reichenbachiella ulvae TaxID=2980104 RepID=A0ABT3CPZ1_9BACT|nr:DUF5074 domain-containing protein [Reichenbachiella ulvae]MCV9385761.1 hypothetical protein [Reichenbachiella ulvae]
MKTNTLFNTWIKYSVFVLALVLSSCSEDEGTGFVPGQDGFFIVNEGAWGNANASLSYLDKATGSVSNNLFETATGKPLGDQAQSMTIFNDQGFIVVQNSSKIEVISTLDYSLVATIDEELPSPRYFLGVDASKAYVSDWGADGSTGTIKVIDLSTYTVTKTISTGAGTNQMVLVGDRVYAANSGGWSYDNTVVVLDTNTDEVVATIEVGDNPSSLVLDQNNNVWVTGSGRSVYNEDWSLNTEESTPGFLAKIDTDNNTSQLKIEAPALGVGPSRLLVDATGETLIFKYQGGVYTASINMNIASANVQDFHNLFNDENIYGLGVDLSTNQIITGIAPDYTNPGSIKIYQIDGSFIEEHTVGIGPNGIAY